MTLNLVPIANQVVVAALKNFSVEQFELRGELPAFLKVYEQDPPYCCRSFVGGLEVFVLKYDSTTSCDQKGSCFSSVRCLGTGLDTFDSVPVAAAVAVVESCEIQVLDRPPTEL